MENIELDVGGTKFKGVWIAILFSFASTIGGGIWTASEFFNRLSAQEEAVQNIVISQEVIKSKFDDIDSDVTAKLAAFTTNIATVEQQLKDNDVSGLQGKLATLGTNLEQIMKRQGELLDLRDKIAEVEKITSEQSITISAKIDKLSEYNDEMKRVKREIDDLWNGMDALSNPLL